MRIVIDLDGTICPIKDKNSSYQDLVPLEGAVERIKQLKSMGHYIIISTARNMATQESNIGKVIKNIGKVTLDWLDKFDIPYDEIYFGKPNAQVYIDDRALRFSDWDSISHESLTQIAKEK
ncbi:capsular biosynthesis protein [bacterium]|jgi:capsule biosynthesis phosphatase|nr:capsular biosynthesis protein [Candidatus Elulimicrobium humile]